jgi:heme/copper-type cytochrome/quinol oxidase subunit 3
MTGLRVPGDAAVNRANAVLGLILQISPWLLGFTTTAAAAWTAGIGGIVITVISFAAFIHLREWKEWVSLMTGLSLVTAPWLFGFAAIPPAVGAHVVIGLLVTALAAIELWRVHGTHARPT